MESARCKAFMYAADTGSFTKAAERLNYTPSGVSQLVGALENETGLTLLRRTRKGVTLTPDGEILLPAVREFLEKENIFTVKYAGKYIITKEDVIKLLISDGYNGSSHKSERHIKALMMSEII